MLEQIHSHLEPARVLHQVYARELYYPDRRHDLCDDAEALQVAVMRLDAGKRFRPHQHIERHRTITRTQEAWVILGGHVRAEYYDTDGTPLATRDLSAGDITMTFAGGHTYQCLTDSSEVVEVKLGPYIGTEGDKAFIE